MGFYFGWNLLQVWNLFTSPTKRLFRNYGNLVKVKYIKIGQKEKLRELCLE